MSITKNMPLKRYSSMKKKFGKIRTIFDIENWSTKKLLRWKSAIYHSIKLRFDVEVAGKFLNGIYCAVTCRQIYY